MNRQTDKTDRQTRQTDRQTKGKYINLLLSLHGRKEQKPFEDKNIQTDRQNEQRDREMGKHKQTDRKYLMIQREQRRLDKWTNYQTKINIQNGQTEILKHEHTDRQKNRH